MSLGVLPNSIVFAFSLYTVFPNNLMERVGGISSKSLVQILSANTKERRHRLSPLYVCPWKRLAAIFPPDKK